MKVGFIPKIQRMELSQRHAPVEQIEAEPMLYSASWNFARKYGGPLTNQVMGRSARAVKFMLDTQIDTYPYLVIDTRVHMLMPGFYPAIPGWHCDATPRTEHYVRHFLGDGAILLFSGQTLHRATPALQRGWRFFFRASMMQHPPATKIRRQTQVYTSESTGW